MITSLPKIDAKIKEIESFNKLSVKQKKEKLISDFKLRVEQKVTEGKLDRAKADTLIKDFTEETNIADHYALVLFAVVGALMLTSFKNMTTLFLGIEIMSIPLYVLAASKKSDIKSNEAGFKYLIMGSFASAILLFGIALIYGASGSFNMIEITNYITLNEGNIPMFFHVGVGKSTVHEYIFIFTIKR